MMQPIDIFKETIYVKKFQGNLDIITKHINHIVEFDSGRKLSNIGGYQSRDISFGFDEILQQAYDGLKEVGINSRLVNFWLNINKGDNYNSPHIHATDFVSMVYYHQVCCDNCPIVFTSLVPQLQVGSFEKVPNNQDMLFFSGILPHAVKGCGNKEHTRISLAFNFRIL